MKKTIFVCLMLVLSMTFVSALEVSVNDYDPKPAEAGKAVNVWLKIDNPFEDPEQGVSIELTPQDGLSLTPGEEVRKNVGIIAPRSAQIVQFRLLVSDKAFEGSNAIEARLYKSGTSVLKRDLSIEVTEKDFKEVNLAVGDIESDPSRIKPDDDNVKLDVTIQNLGDGKAQGVKAELIELPQGITLSESYSGTSLLGNIDADSTAIATFYIDVDDTVEAKQYTANIKMTYKYKPDEDEDDFLFEQQNIPLLIAVKPIPLYEITDITLTPSVLTAGDENVELRVTVKNIGEEEGESVRLKAYGKTEQPITFDTSNDFIAPSLKPGESGQGTLRFDIEETAALQTYWLDIEIKNIVNEDIITYEKKVAVEVSNPKPNNPWSFVYIGLAAIAIVLIYMYLKKRRRAKPKAKKIDL